MLFPAYDTDRRRIVWVTDDPENMPQEAWDLRFLQTYADLLDDIENERTIHVEIITYDDRV